jgi:hypothetical protein
MHDPPVGREISLTLLQDSNVPYALVYVCQRTVTGLKRKKSLSFNQRQGTNSRAYLKVLGVPDAWQVPVDPYMRLPVSRRAVVMIS